MQTLQDLIHKFEVGEGRRSIHIAAGILLFITVLFLYNLREATGFASQEAMDSAQVARNIAEGRGFTTSFIRPLSMRLLSEQRSVLDDPYMVKGDHPDLANAPLYPLMLAGAMKVLPFNYEIPALRSKNFRRFQPEVLIGYVNQGFFILSAGVLFLLARRLFDSSVAWLCSIVFLGTDLMWRFSFSGLSTNLVIFLFLLLVSCLVALEHGVPLQNPDGSDEKTGRGTGFFIVMSLLAGLLLAALGLTRYSLICLVVPVVAFCCLFLRGHRLLTSLVILITSLVVMAPWLWRNHQLSGNFFGTASYSIWQDSSLYTESELERTLSGELNSTVLGENISKVLKNSAEITEHQIPRLGGSWLSALFLAGLLMPFSNPRLNRVRILTLLSLVTLLFAQALSRTYLSRDSVDINSENLVILTLPLVLLFGAAFFSVLLDHLDLSFFGAHFYVSTLVVLLACLPLIFRILPPRQSPVAYPPYSPPLIQRVGNWFSDQELIMSDMPWAVAWYGSSRCLWLTRNVEPDYFEIHDNHKAINGLYLTPITTDGTFITQMIRNNDWAWGRLHMDIVLRQNLPKGFPLLHVDDGFLPDQLVLTDWPRWSSERE